MTPGLATGDKKIGSDRKAAFFSRAKSVHKESAILVFSAFALVSCQEKSGESPEGQARPSSSSELVAIPLASPGKREGNVPLFEKMVPEQTGISFVNEVDSQNRLRVSNVGVGVAAGDCDGDGAIDLYFTSQDSTNRLFRQVDPWKFEDVTEMAGVGGTDGNSTGASFIDIDNDGDLDLYVCYQNAADQLFVNQGDGSFVEDAESHGLGDTGPCTMASFCDYDRDGDLDLYLVRYRIFETGFLTHPDLDFSGGRLQEEKGESDRLYRNDGEGQFVDVTENSGIVMDRAIGLSATWWDYNHDGWPDLYVSNDYGGPDHFYHNHGDGTFEDIADRALPYLPWFSMGSDAGDLNNDGLFDFIGADMAATDHFNEKVQMGDIADTRDFLIHASPQQMMRNAVYVNTDTGRFLELGHFTGMASTDWTWAVRIADFDNDGWQDVFYTNGFYYNARDSDRELAARLRVEWDRARAKDGKPQEGKRFADYLRELGFDEEVFERLERTPLAQKNLVFRNERDLRFANVTDEWGLDEALVSFGATVCDLDGDGDLDLVTNGLDDSARIYQNTGTEGNRVTVRLRGTASNHFGIGSVVTVKTRSGEQVRQLHASRGYQGGCYPELHFGTGEDSTIESLVVEWPSGTRQEWKGLETGFRYDLRETSNPEPMKPSPALPFRFGPEETGETRFIELPPAQRDAITHIEQEYNDFADQILLPYQVSRLGPGVAFSGSDEGKDPLIWLAGAFGQAGQFVSKNRYGDWRKSMTSWSREALRDAMSEDMGGLFFDADGDGDEDLFVVSGGVEMGRDAVELRDRLYLDNGNGQFVPSADGTVPDIRDSGSVAAACDFDRDGDLDLFVGGRVIPQEYPVPASSRILRNEKGTFTDATAEVFSSSGGAFNGLITGALWSDIDGDGWVDLLVTQEWGPVLVFKNKQGSLVDQTGLSGTADYTGWWNGITGGDIDNDGDIDFAVSNFGLNTKYKISEGKPRKIFYADFDGDGEGDVVEAKFGGEALLPVRGRSCSTLAMPAIGEKFPTYRKFATASLAELYGEEILNGSISREANFLSSALLINDGSGKFEVRELPRFAQTAPSFGVALRDFDGDGNLDLLMNQNFFPNQIETGPMTTALGLFLTGDGTGALEPVWPAKSGFFVPDDARSLAIGDLNDDGWPDAVIGVNDGPLKMFLNRGPLGGARLLKVSLENVPPNWRGVGAAVKLTTAGGRVQSQEVYAGGSYLSQSQPDLYFGLVKDEQITTIEVRWPDGETTRFVEGFEGTSVVLKRQPGG